MIDEKTLHLLDWSQVAQALAGQARTPYGQAEASLALPLTPSQAEAMRRRVSSWRTLLTEGRDIPLGHVPDVREHLALASRGGSLDGQGLLDVADNMELCSRLGKFLNGGGVPDNLAQSAPFLPDFSAVSTRIRRVIDASGGIRDDASPVLQASVEEERTRTLELRTRSEALLDEEPLRSMLRDRYVTQREGRFVLPIRIEHSNTVQGIVHDASASGATVYVEPRELNVANNRLTQARARIREEISRLLAELTQALAQVTDELGAALTIVGGIDAEVARARLAEEWDAVEPQAADHIRLRQIRQPLLVLRGLEEVVPIDIEHPGAGRGVILSGPNAGGKTAALKTLGLAIVLARAGFHIPATEAWLPLTWDVGVELGDPQDLGEDLSTFSGHMKRLVEISRNAGRGTLLLVDELLKGTDPADGAPLGRAWLEETVARDVAVWVTTHYGSIKALPVVDERFHSARTSVEQGHPAYHIVYGEAGSSFAFETAQKYGFSSTALEKARQYREGEVTRAEEALAEIDTLRKQLRDSTQKVERERTEQVRLRDRLEAELSMLERERKALIKRSAETTLHQLDRARDSARAAEREIKLRKESARTQGTQVAKTRRKLERTLSELEVAGQVTVEDLAPGTVVYSRRFRKNGVVTRVTEKQQVALQVGPLQVTVGVDDLAPAQQEAKPTFDAGQRRRPLPAQVPDRLDVRGQRLDEALRMVDHWMDGAFASGQGGTLTIVHGIATGALRNGVRGYLREHPAGLSFRPGEENEGGDAVTRILLED